MIPLHVLPWRTPISCLSFEHRFSYLPKSSSHARSGCLLIIILHHDPHSPSQELHQAPCLTLGCGHSFHAHCLHQIVDAGWPKVEPMLQLGLGLGLRGLEGGRRGISQPLFRVSSCQRDTHQSVPVLSASPVFSCSAPRKMPRGDT